MMLARPKRALKGSATGVSLPAPTGGLNTFNPAMGLPPTDCMLLRNQLGAENGLRVRLGERQWATGLTGAADNRVRTVIPYTGSTPTATRNFVTTSSGIWNVTDSGGVTTPRVLGGTYAVGDFVSEGGASWVCSIAGEAHPSNPLPTVWAGSTAYSIGDRVVNGDGVYLCDTSGTSDTVGGPIGTSLNITDGTARWDYEGPSATVSDGNCNWRYVASNTSPTLVLSFASTAGDAGYGVFHGHTTTAGNFLWYADEVNGLHLYTESTDTWSDATTLAGSITGVDPADLVFVTVFKGFTLFAVRDSTEIRVLPVNSIGGATSRIDVGYKLQAGGNVVGMWSWTYDGGAGLDDALVVVSRGGDVQVWQGTDPTDSAAFGNTGVWGIGKTPAGRNLATTFGGDLLLLSRSGIIPMSRLVLGKVEGAGQYETAKIEGLFNSLMVTRGDLRGWSLALHPEESALIVTVPTGADTATTQLAMSLATRSWSELRGLDIYSCASHEGKLYYGTTNGAVHINDGYVDGVTLAAPSSYRAIDFQGIGAFQNFGVGTQKQVHLIKFYFLTGSQPTVDVDARYDFDLTELPAVTYAAPGTGSLWDVGTWDSATWGGTATAFSAVRGACGTGANVAIAWRGASVDRTVLTGFEISFSQGGML